MTVHLISVGLSVLRALEDPHGNLSGKPDLAEAIRAGRPHELLGREGIGDAERDMASGWAADALGGEGTGAARRLRDLATAVRPAEWPRDMSAELDTFGQVQHGSYVLGGKDIAILVCSDTPPGLLAGAWNAIAIADGDLDRVRYLPEPSLPIGHDVRSRVTMVRVTGMDAGDAGFRGAMRGLGFLARRLFSSGNLTRGEEFRFYLSGGFKAAIPYLIGMAEAVRSVDNDCLRGLGAADLVPAPVPYPVEAFVAHETAGPNTPPIQLPLRRLVARAVQEELSGYDEAGRRTGKPGSALLEGYAFDVRRKWGKDICELTPFGEGLRALFGMSAERQGE